ncbi:hypothetical protein Btru_047110 [Bulinus truncatus]|nr:hypothetical protein Btru_047110 [Bulinus truncatus]
MLREHNQRIEEVKQKCCEVCQLVATRVLPLERLKDGFSQNVSAIEVNNSKILVLENDVGNLKRFATEMMFSPIGFTAYLNEPVQLSASNTLLNGFTDVKVNVQNCFDLATGYFTAPFDGLYSVSVTLCQMSTGYLEAFIFHGKHADQGDDSWVAHVIGHREINGNSDTGVAVVSIKKQDTLYIKVTDLGLLNCPWLTECTSFSCFSIDRC